MFDQNREERLLHMLRDISNRNYKHRWYREIIIYDAKKRCIFSPCFRDHILHHLLYAQLYPILDTKMVHSSFACRVWYGNHRAIASLRHIVRKENRKFILKWDELYYYKIDLSKYFFSIHHSLLKRKLRRYISDETYLYLIDIILESYSAGQQYDELLSDFDFYTTTKSKGLPIWSILSQLFANFFLNDFDQFLKHTLKLRFVRYMDDVVLLWSREELSVARIRIREFFVKEKLILHPRKQHFHPVSESISFVGYKIRHGKIFVWNRAKQSLLGFIDKYGVHEEVYENNNELSARLASRCGAFHHSVRAGQNYLISLGL